MLVFFSMSRTLSLICLTFLSKEFVAQEKLKIAELPLTIFRKKWPRVLKFWYSLVLQKCQYKYDYYYAFMVSVTFSKISGIYFKKVPIDTAKIAKYARDNFQTRVLEISLLWPLLWEILIMLFRYLCPIMKRALEIVSLL